MRMTTKGKRQGTALSFILALALAAPALFAQEEAGTWAFTGWARANSGWNFQADTVLGKATGAEATLTYTKGNWKVAGTATVNSPDFGTTHDANGNITATYTLNGWEASVKTAANFGATPTTKTAQFSMKKWNQKEDLWGLVGVAAFTDNSQEWPLFDFEYNKGSGDNKAAFFINFWDKKILVEGGYGAYTDTVWKSPGSLGTQYDDDSALRVQFNFVKGLSFGFAYLPAVHKNGEPGGFASPGFASWKPVDAVRATTFGAKYTGGPLILAAGLNLKENAENLYAGFSYTLLDRLTITADGAAKNLGVFDTTGDLTLSEQIKYVDNRLEIGLTLGERGLAGTSGDNFKFELGPYIQYDIIDKVARGKLQFSLGKGFGDLVKNDSSWSVTTDFGWSLAGKPHIDPNEVGTGFGIGYVCGVTKEAGVEKITNQLYFGFKVSF